MQKVNVKDQSVQKIEKYKRTHGWTEAIALLDSLIWLVNVVQVQLLVTLKYQTLSQYSDFKIPEYLIHWKTDNMFMFIVFVNTSIHSDCDRQQNSVSN